MPAGKPEQLAVIRNPHHIAAIDHRLIGLAQGDRPAITARTLAVNVYDVGLNER